MLMRFDPFRELAFRELERMSQAMTAQGTAASAATVPLDAYRDGDPRPSARQPEPSRGAEGVTSAQRCAVSTST